MAGTLQKLIVTNEDTKESFPVLFNPSEYSIESAIVWSEQFKRAMVPDLQYGGTERKKLSMELFFDSHEAKDDVRKQTFKITSLLIFHRDQHRPPLITLSWGT